VKLTSAKKGHGTQSGVFSQGQFVVKQTRDSMTELKLTGSSFEVCDQAKRLGKPVAAAASRRRRLFGRAHGRFRTRGRNSSATVRGTEWLTEDRCEGTVTRNMSSSPSSKVETKTNELEFDLDPGQTATGYCNKFVIEPDTYCVMLLAQPADGLIGAGILTSVSLIPQLVKIIREKKAENISYGMLLTLLAGLGCWVWYGLLKEDLPIIITNVFSFLVNALVIGFTVKYKP
jgi:MtN3 and saliva related transmembrane protein